MLVTPLPPTLYLIGRVGDQTNSKRTSVCSRLYANGCKRAPPDVTQLPNPMGNAILIRHGHHLSVGPIYSYGPSSSSKLANLRAAIFEPIRQGQGQIRCLSSSTTSTFHDAG